MSKFRLMPGTLLTTSEVAERCRKSPRTIVRWADRGDLRIAHTAGGERLFDPVDVDALVAKLAEKAEELAASLREQPAGAAAS